jgi:hypothetical protein
VLISAQRDPLLLIVVVVAALSFCLELLPSG